MSPIKPPSSRTPEPVGESQAGRRDRAQAGQAERLAAALRDNLKRRKAQARARHEEGPAATKADPHRP